jgi:hypothetical protein
MYTQVVYCLERVPAVVAKKPELKNVEPFFVSVPGPVCWLLHPEAENACLLKGPC